jgi:pre-mRNA-splicing factor SYF1
LKIANTQTILNYCEYLENNHYYEETFRVFEQAISFFTWPHAYDIWIMYLTKFVQRYGGQKIERARDLFEQAIAAAPKDVKYNNIESESILLHVFRIRGKLWTTE